MMQQKTNFLKAAWVAGSISVLASCTKVDVKFGESTIADPNIAYIDTISYELSTIQADSFATSQTNTAMIGLHNDADFGTLEAETYFHLGAPGTNLLPDQAIYDSAKLFIQPNGNYYGDTTAPFNFQVYSLAEDIDLDGATYFYNLHRLATNPVPMVSYRNYIRPSLKENIAIPLPNSLGVDLFNKLKSNSDTISDNSFFFQYIRGLSIKGTSTNRAVYAFNAADSNLYLRVFYHTSNPNPESATVDFKYVADNMQFNYVHANRANTLLQTLAPNTTQKISSSLTGNKAFQQAGAGLQIRIDLPYLRNFRTENNYRKILRAELYVRPYGYGPGSLYSLPAPAILSQMTADNYADSVVLDVANSAQQSIVPFIDNLYGKDTYYLYDITNYVNNIINGTTENYNALTLETPASAGLNGIDRLILANSNLYKSIEVRIYRLTL